MGIEWAGYGGAQLREVSQGGVAGKAGLQVICFRRGAVGLVGAGRASWPAGWG